MAVAPLPKVSTRAGAPARPSLVANTPGTQVSGASGQTSTFRGGPAKTVAVGG